MIARIFLISYQNKIRLSKKKKTKLDGYVKEINYTQCRQYQTS